MKKYILYILLFSFCFTGLVHVQVEAKKKTIKIIPAITIKTGKHKKLKAVVFPKKYKKRLKWKSSNSAIVSVSQKGLLRARRKGKARITAYIRKNSGVILKKAICRVTVIADPAPKETPPVDEAFPYVYDWNIMKKTDPSFILPDNIPMPDADTYNKALLSALSELNRLRKKENPSLPVISLANGVMQKTVLTRAQDCMFYFDHTRPDGSSRSTAGLTGFAPEVCSFEMSSDELESPQTSAVKILWSSPSHKEILMSKDYDRIGIGFCYLKNKQNGKYYCTMVMQTAGFANNHELKGNKKLLSDQINTFRKNNGLSELSSDYNLYYDFLASSNTYCNQKRAKNYCTIKGEAIEYTQAPDIELKTWFAKEAYTTVPMLEFRLMVDSSNYPLFTRLSQNYGRYDDDGVERFYSAYTWNGAEADKNFDRICELLFENREFIDVISNPGMNCLFIGSYYDHIILGKF